MGKSRNDILQGTLVLLILKTLLSQGRMHGYAITNHIQRISARGRKELAHEEENWERLTEGVRRVLRFA
jgi:hypothetical protein